MSKNETSYIRSPSQRRGHQRIQCILDAAAEIIKESSLEQLTIQGLAKRSETSPGSLYHFFSDIESVKSLLKEGYDSQLDMMLMEIQKGHTQENWVVMKPDNVINDLFLPYANFILMNRAYLPLVQHDGFTFKNSGFLNYFAEIIHLRNPRLSKDEVLNEATFLHSVAIGTLQQAFQRGKRLPYDFIPNILLVLTLYFCHLEVKRSKEF